MKQKVAIYGLGQETEKNIGTLSDCYDVVGLLDSFQDTGEMYGFPVVSVSNAIENGIEKIIVIARPGSCKAIANKIRKICEENEVSVVDINGNNLIVKNVVSYNFDGIVGYKKADLIEKINGAETVSFDLFDTLIMRQALCYESFVALLGYRVWQEGYCIKDFANKRLKAEIELSRNCVPTLRDIYEYMHLDCYQDDIEKLVQIEWSIDKSLLIPRSEMVELINELIASGKKTYITTDTYYNEKQIREIIEKCGIDRKAKLLISCEQGMTKSQGLFEVLKEKSVSESILHIGDDIQADIERAKDCGITSFRIYSARDMFELLGFLGLQNDIRSVFDEIKVGILMADIFNTPFMFEGENSLSLSSPRKIGFITYAPMIMDFVYWIREVAGRKKIQSILFSARDGYILQKIYSLLYPDDNTYYFLSSRIAVSRACVENQNDIEYIESTRFTGSLTEELQVRYGINASDFAEEINLQENGIMQYKDVILTVAKQKRQNYLKYVEGLNLSEGKLAFIDLSARGTIQKYCEKLMGKKMSGIYFLQLEPEFARKNNLDIIPFYEDDESSNNTVTKDFYIMEPVISSPNPSVEEFDEKGSPIYAKEDRSREEIDAMEQIQHGILDYVSLICSICPKNVIEINKKLDEEIFSLIHKIKISSKDFYLLRNIDSFVNRVMDIDVGV